jgi:hypothetical protein
MGGFGSVGIYDLNGKKIKIIYKGEFQPGLNEFFWDAKKDAGIQSGFYFVRLNISGRTITKKIITN